MQTETRVVLRRLILEQYATTSRAGIAELVKAETGEEINTNDVSRMVSSLRFSGDLPREKPNYIRWTDDKVTELVMLAGKVPVSEIAKHFGTTRDAITAEGNRLGIRFKVIGATPSEILGDTTNTTTEVTNERA